MVEIRTTEVTVYATSTSYLQVLETVTAYTSTDVLTASTTVTASASSVLKAKRHKKRGGGCKTTSTTLSTDPSSATPSSADPSSTAVSASDSTSSTPEPSSATTPPPGPVSAAPDCPSLEAYSSACSCIWAASDATQTVTAQLPDTTVLVSETATVDVPSTSTDWTTNTVTVSVTQGATTTVTSTISTGLVTTTTITKTCPAPMPTETGQIAVVGGPWNGETLINTSPLVVVTTGQGFQAVVARAGGQPYLASNPAIKMWIIYQSSIGRVYFSNVANPGTTYTAVSCSVSDTTNVLSCRAGSLGVDTFFNVPTNGQLYMAAAAYLPTYASPHTVVSLKVVTC